MIYLLLYLVIITKIVLIGEDSFYISGGKKENVFSIILIMEVINPERLQFGLSTCYMIIQITIKYVIRNHSQIQGTRDNCTPGANLIYKYLFDSPSPSK